MGGLVGFGGVWWGFLWGFVGFLEYGSGDSSKLVGSRYSSSPSLPWPPMEANA